MRLSYHDVGSVRQRGCATQVGEQPFQRYGKPRARNLLWNRFVAGTRHQLVNNDELGLRSSRNAQMFRYNETILVCPVVENFANEEDGDVLLLRRLRVKEAL